MVRLFYFLLFLIGFQAFTQGTQCEQADPFCSSDAFTFPNNYSGTSAQTGPFYDCLASVPNPAWYYLFIDNSGTLNFQISQVSTSGQGIDVDFICYGPFNNPVTACQAELTSPNVVACSYSPNATESFTIPNAQAGEYYIVLITNYSGQQGDITFQQTNAGQAGSGTTDCSIVCTVNIPDDLTLCEGTPYTINTVLGNSNMADTAVYRWYKDGVLLPDTTSSLTITNTSVSTHTYRVEVDAQYCTATAFDEMTITYENPFTGLELNNLPTLYSCKDYQTNTTDFDLTQNNSIIANINNINDFNFKFFKDVNLTDEIINPTTYQINQNSEIIYIQIFSNSFQSCHETTFFEIVTIESPSFEIDFPIQYKCDNIIGDSSTFQVINAQDNYNFVWIDQNGNTINTTDTFTTDVSGTYTVRAISTNGNNCQAEKQIELIGVLPATITDVIVLEYYIADNFSIEVKIEGNGFYEYALNDENGVYQDEPYFKNLSPGIYTVYVREKNGCGISSMEVSVFGFPKFFTPNDDGINDIWKVNNLFFKDDAKITIFDRHGRVLSVFYPSKNQGWNGLFNGKQLNPTDYWFTAEVIDRFGKKKIRKGHFTLIR
jgi:gliding motility-associated-like protein